jgi:hypothetical protein
MEAARNEIPFGTDEDDSNTLAALRIALASLEAEAVADVVAWSSPNEEREPVMSACAVMIQAWSLYTAPPSAGDLCLMACLKASYRMLRSPSSGLSIMEKSCLKV